jgi:Protein of unknown function (DUF2865)
LIAAIAVVATIIPTAPASAQNLLDFLLNAVRRPSPPPATTAYADPAPSAPGNPEQDRSIAAPIGPSSAFCVRLCDGRYFPVQRGGTSAAQYCNSVCPATQTRVYSGGGIDHAVAGDGSRYSALPNAFAFRERIVESCSCNGRDSVGLVTLSVADDPTLRAGDIVATNNGFVAFTGNRNTAAAFTPIQSYPGLSAEWRERLALTRIVPRNATPVTPEAVRASAAAVRGAADRRVQLDR